MESLSIQVSLPSAPHLFDPLPDKLALLAQFVTFFARFEYALKRARYLRGNEQKAEPDWQGYSDKLAGRFETVASEDFARAVDYIIDHPPRKQVIRGGGLAWAEVERGRTESYESWVLSLVRVVRNNLFHGGKYPYPYNQVPEASRDSQLLRACLVILHQCLSLTPKVERSFVNVEF